jgi:iron(III) transport system ATP-binding protein
MQVAPQATEGRTGSGPMIKVTGLTKRFVKGSDMAAVNDVSFEVEDKEVLTLFGPSGCGKTTTLRCIAGLEKPDAGEISIGGKIVTSGEKGIFLPPEKRNIGLVFQSYALWPHMKVFDNVAYGLRVKHVPKAEIEKRVKNVLEVVELSGFEKRYPAQLSGGQQQRVALARSLVYEPKVLLLDEPLSNLDAKVREKTRQELHTLLKKVGISTVYVTHDQEEAFQISDQIAVMNAGQILQVGSPHDIYHDPNNQFVAAFVGHSNLINGSVTAVLPGSGNGSASGTVRIFGSYDVDCRLPKGLKQGDKCLVMVRSNEVGLYMTPPQQKYVKCTVVSRAYKGALTDHVVKIGDTLVTVSTHRYCGLNDVGAETPAEREREHYVVIRGDSISVVAA